MRAMGPSGVASNTTGSALNAQGMKAAGAAGRSMAHKMRQAWHGACAPGAESVLPPQRSVEADIWVSVVPSAAMASGAEWVKLSASSAITSAALISSAMTRPMAPAPLCMWTFLPHARPAGNGTGGPKPASNWRRTPRAAERSHRQARRPDGDTGASSACATDTGRSPRQSKPRLRGRESPQTRTCAVGRGAARHHR